MLPINLSLSPKGNKFLRSQETMGVRPVKFFFEAGCTEVHLVSYLLLFCCKLLNNVRVIGVFIDPIIHFLVQSVRG